MVSFGDGLGDVDSKSDGGRGEFSKGVLTTRGGRGDLPTDEARFGCGRPGRLRAVAIAGGHGGFVGGDDLVGFAVEAEGAVVDP